MASQETTSTFDPLFEKVGAHEGCGGLLRIAALDPSGSGQLTDEEADAFIRECKPEPLVGAADGGLERVYFHQYLNMLKDDS